MPGAAELQVEMQALMDLQDQLTALKNTPVPEITDDMIDAAKNIKFQQNDIIDNMTEELNLQLVKTLFPSHDPVCEYLLVTKFAGVTA